MPIEPATRVIGAAFTSGCVTVHGFRRHPDAVTLVLAPVAYALATTVASLLAARFSWAAAPDPGGGWIFVPLSGAEPPPAP
jgi:hypothetical protein